MAVDKTLWGVDCYGDEIHVGDVYYELNDDLVLDDNVIQWLHEHRLEALEDDGY